MFDDLKMNWKRLRASPPGRRFRDRHERRRKSQSSPARRTLWMGAGVVLALVGVIFLVIPGPGLPILAVGAGLLAGESGKFAGLLDAFEVWVRKALSAARRSWRRWPLWGRAAAVVAAFVVAGAAGVAAYRVAFGG